MATFILLALVLLLDTTLKLNRLGLIELPTVRLVSVAVRRFIHIKSDLILLIFEMNLKFRFVNDKANTKNQ